MSMSLKWGYVLHLGRTVADITIFRRSNGCNRSCFEVPTNIAKARASTFGEFEHVNNPCTYLLLHVGRSLHDNLFVSYTIIDIIICFNTITQ